MNPGTDNSLFGKHTSMYGKGTKFGTTTSKGCYINFQPHGGLFGEGDGCYLLINEASILWLPNYGQ